MTPLAIYIHIPFCTVKCGYCDFNAYAGLDALKPTYMQAITTELKRWAAHVEARPVTSVFCGGGTPGEVPPATIDAALDAIRSAFNVSENCEISIEVNPGSTGPAALAELHAAGVTRVSVGVQRLDASELQFLDRIHSPAAAAATVAAARSLGFDVSLDLIYGLPGETIDQWQSTLLAALALNPDHISTYALTVEEQTPLALRVARGDVTPADPDLVAEMYDTTRAILRDHGWEHYEISNFARPGHRSRHNQVYWHGGDYLGIGAGAHGLFAGVRYENLAHPARYIDSVATPGALPIAAAYRPNHTMAMADWLEARLRLVEGFPLREFEEQFGLPLPGATVPALDELVGGRLLVVTGGAVRLSERGLQLHSEVVVQFLVAMEAQFGPSAAAPVAPGDGWP